MHSNDGIKEEERPKVPKEIETSKIESPENFNNDFFENSNNESETAVETKTQEQTPYRPNAVYIENGKVYRTDNECNLHEIDLKTELNNLTALAKGDYSKTLLPNSTYDVGGHKYETDDNGKVSEYKRDQSIKDYEQREREAKENGEESPHNKVEKGNYGEMKTDNDLEKNGYNRISKEKVTAINETVHQGIDGVYENSNPPPKYIIVDSKYGTAGLNPNTKDGKQMSEQWIDNRLDTSVGKEKADEIRKEMILNPDNVKSIVAHVDSEGNVTYNELDADANIIKKGVEL